MALVYNWVQGTLVQSPSAVLLSHPSRPDRCGECRPLDCRFPSMLPRGAKCVCWYVGWCICVCVSLAVLHVNLLICSGEAKVRF